MTLLQSIRVVPVAHSLSRVIHLPRRTRWSHDMYAKESLVAEHHHEPCLYISTHKKAQIEENMWEERHRSVRSTNLSDSCRGHCCADRELTSRFKERRVPHQARHGIKSDLKVPRTRFRDSQSRTTVDMWKQATDRHGHAGKSDT